MYIITHKYFIYFFKLFFVNLGTYFIYLKLANVKNNTKNMLKAIFMTLIISMICLIIGESTDTINSRIIQVILLSIEFYIFNKKEIEYSIVITIISLCISNIIFFVSVIINDLPNLLFKSQNDYIVFAFIVIGYWIITYCVLKIKRIKNGLSFLNEKTEKDFFYILILNISTIIFFLIEIFSKYNKDLANKMGLGIIIFSIMLILVIKKSFQLYYKQTLMMKQLEESNKELIHKEKEIEKLEQENLDFGKVSHSLAHKQKVLEYKIDQLMLNTEIAEEIDIKDRLQEISKKLYKKPIVELSKTGITQIDDMLTFMQSECIKNNIDFSFQLIGNVYYIINNIISVEQLEILIADHVKDAIIAVKHTDNINKSILVRLGKIEDCYGLYIYDSGIEFEKEILKNLGKKPSTTHKDEGGTGMGFMNTFDTLRECNGSLIINELGQPSKDNYTKIVMIKFDNKNEFNIISYRN